MIKLDDVRPGKTVYAVNKTTGEVDAVTVSGGVRDGLVALTLPGIEIPVYASPEWLYPTREEAEADSANAVAAWKRSVGD